MSRGPGRQQRDILDAVAKDPGGVIVTHPSMTTSEKVSRRRAAHQLADAGRIQLTAERFRGLDGRPVTQLIAWPLGVATPESHVQERGGGQHVILPGAHGTATNEMIAALSGVSVSTVKRERAAMDSGHAEPTPAELPAASQRIVSDIQSVLDALIPQET